MCVDSCIALDFYYSTQEAFFLVNSRYMDSFSGAHEAVNSNSYVQDSNVITKRMVGNGTGWGGPA